MFVLSPLHSPLCYVIGHCGRDITSIKHLSNRNIARILTRTTKVQASLPPRTRHTNITTRPITRACHLIHLPHSLLPPLLALFLGLVLLHPVNESEKGGVRGSTPCRHVAPEQVVHNARGPAVPRHAAAIACQG